MASQAAAIIDVATTHAWSAEVYSSLSLASRIADTLAAGRDRLKLTGFLWKTNRRIDQMFEAIYEPGEAKGQTRPELTRERIAEIAQLLHRLALVFAQIYEKAKKRRLLNATLLAGNLARLEVNSGRLDELADFLDDYLHPEADDQRCQETIAAFKRGETVPLSDLI